MLTGVEAPVTREELEAAQCWDSSDVVPRRPVMTAFRQLMRLHHARWREAHGHPIGTQPFNPRPGVDARLVGSRIPLPYARETGATFLTASALDAARKRTETVEPEQSIDHQGLWADLLASEALAFNLFGDLAGDLARADRAVHAWVPDAPGAQKKFDAKFSLGFPLLSDPGHAVADAYGVWGEKVLFGRTIVGIIRSSFLIGEDGKILAAWYRVPAGRTVERALEALA